MHLGLTKHQKPIIGTQNIKKAKHNTEESHQSNESEQEKRKGTEKSYENQKTIFKMAVNTYLSRITLNTNGLIAPIKRHRMQEWIKKARPTIYCLQETHVRPKGTYSLKLKG